MKFFLLELYHFDFAVLDFMVETELKSYQLADVATLQTFWNDVLFCLTFWKMFTNSIFIESLMKFSYLVILAAALILVQFD